MSLITLRVLGNTPPSGSSNQNPVRNFVGFTEKGRAAFSRMAADHESWIDELLGNIDGDNALELAADLERVAPQARSNPR